MEQSILKSVKKTLNIAPNDDAFDEDVLIHTNSVFSTITQLGVGPQVGFSIEDDTAVWSDLLLTEVQLGLVKTYVYLKVRMLFDPPTTSFQLDAMTRQIEQLEWRINSTHEVTIPPEEVIA